MIVMEKFEGKTRIKPLYQVIKHLSRNTVIKRIVVTTISDIRLLYIEQPSNFFTVKNYINLLVISFTTNFSTNQNAKT